MQNLSTDYLYIHDLEFELTTYHRKINWNLNGKARKLNLLNSISKQFNR